VAPPPAQTNRSIDPCLCAEARLAVKRAARAEAREIRMKELERQQKEVEERTDRDFLDRGSRTASTLSAATLASLAGASSRRGSCDTSVSLETEASLREMKDSLVEAEERYRRAMVSNAQLHNDKTMLMYQVETLREELSDTEELLWEARRHRDDTSKELERERHSHSVLKLQFRDLEDMLRQTEDLEQNPIKRCPPGTDGHPPAKTLIKDPTVSADRNGSTEKVFKSRLVPPRPARDILLDHRATVLNLLAVEKKPSAEETTCSVGGLEQSCPLTGPEKEGLMTSSRKSSEEDAGSNMSSLTKEQEGTCDVGTQTPGNHLREWGPHGMDEDTVEEKVVPTRWPVGAEGSSFCKDHLGHPEVQCSETKLEPEGDGPPHSRGTRKNLKDWRIHEARANQILRGFFEHTTGQESDSMLVAVRNTFQGLVHRWTSVTNMTKVLSEVLISLHKWIIDLDNLMTTGVESDQGDAGPEEPMRRVSNLSAEGGLMHFRPNQLREDPAFVEVPLAGWSTAPRSVWSAPEMLQPYGSTDQEEKQTIREESEIKSSQEEDLGDHPAMSNSAASETESFTEDFVFVDSYFAEPLQPSFNPKPPLGQPRAEDGKLHVGQSSKVRRLIETTAEEIKAMAVPELVMVSLQEGRQLNGLSWLNVGSTQEQPSGDMDSCEEADEEQDPPPGE
uniref:Uncharacterized protein n=1 Tax=Oryzias latipes TaxID=8090 RepID=A0A3B3IAW8_ORYLA